LSSGAVAGISVGATLGGVALLAILFLWWRHKRAVRVGGVRIKEQNGPNNIDPFTPTANLATTRTEARPYILEQGPIGGDVGQTTGLLTSMTPESSPQTTTMSSTQRRKAEEAGLLAAGGAGGLRLANEARVHGSQTSTTSTEFIQNLPPQPITPATPATPETLSQQQQQQQQPLLNPETVVRHISSGSAFNPRASTSTGPGHLLSPTSPQIHYHIHLPPGAPATAAATNTFPPGSIIHTYENEHDEPAPEYSEQADASTVQHQAPT